MGLMTEHRIRHLPVVEAGKLAGMISIGDVVKLRIETIENEAEQMKSSSPRRGRGQRAYTSFGSNSGASVVNSSLPFFTRR